VESAVARILDANLNRAREALRVLEEHARFARDDPTLTERIKRARHDLAAAAEALPQRELLAARNVASDVGTAISTPREAVRGSTADVAVAAAKRVGEALRCLEEYAKTVDSVVATRFERLRYATYEIEQAMVLGRGGGARISRGRLHVLITESLCRRPWLEVAAAVIEAGVDLLQLREKGMPEREVLTRAKQLRELAHARGAAVVVNDRPDIARLAGADGVHLGQDDLPVAEARRIVGPTAAVGLSTHTVEQVRAALDEGADYIAVGPMFASPTKPSASIAGPRLAAEALALTDRPVVAIGGITAERIGELIQVGVRSIAVCQAVIAAPDPAVACRDLLRRLGAT
jgi:thiamine-phosphate pyrophosphorylase